MLVEAGAGAGDGGGGGGGGGLEQCGRHGQERRRTQKQTDRNAGLVAAAAIKNPCRVATTANITLSGEQTIDGVAVVAADRVLVKSQTY